MSKSESTANRQLTGNRMLSVDQQLVINALEAGIELELDLVLVQEELSCDPLNHTGTFRRSFK